MKYDEDEDLRVSCRNIASLNRGIFHVGEKKASLIRLRSEAAIKQDSFRGGAAPGSVEGMPLTSDKAAKRFGTQWFLLFKRSAE